MKWNLFFIISIFLVIKLAAQHDSYEENLFAEYENKCKIFNKKRELDSTAIYLEKINKLLITHKDSSKFYRRDLIEGSLLIGKSEYHNAMQKLLKASQFFELQQDSTNYFLSKYKIAVCNYYVNRRELAKSGMLEILANPKYITNQMATNALVNVGVVDLEFGILNKEKALVKKAIPSFKKAIAFNQKHKEYSLLASNYSLLAECNIQLKQYSKAIVLLDSAIYYAKKDANSAQNGFALIKKANAYTAKKDYKNALLFVEEAINIYRDANDLPTLLYAFIEKKRLLVAMNNYKEANGVADSIYSLSLKNYDQRFADGITEMETKYKTADKERKILEQRADIAEKVLLIQKKNYQIYGIISLGILLSALVYLLYNQQKLKNKQLVKENKLKITLREIETQNKLQEQRLRISRDLHDNIGTQLSFIISTIDNLKFLTKESNPDLKNKLTHISTFTRATIHQLRDTIWAMNHNEISLEDFQTRILSFIEKAKVSNDNIDISLNVKVKDPIAFTSIKGISLFRVIQEAVNNALKYANAKQIEIHIKQKDNQFLLSIHDNGKGFNKDAVIEGNGLENMRLRVEELGGNFELTSKLNLGTTIQVTCEKEMLNSI